MLEALQLELDIDDWNINTNNKTNPHVQNSNDLIFLSLDSNSGAAIVLVKVSSLNSAKLNNYLREQTCFSISPCLPAYVWVAKYRHETLLFDQ